MLFKLLIAVFVLLFSFSAHAISKAIYGVDNRLDVYEVEHSLYRDIADSTATMIGQENLERRWSLFKGSYYVLKASNMETEGVIAGIFMSGKACPEVNFQKQPTAGVCSGFLVAPDLLLTAGHCMVNQQRCSDFRWVFGYQARKDGEEITIKSSDVYSCKEIVAQKMISPTVVGSFPYGGFGAVEYDYSKSLDYALVRLNRKVRGHDPLMVRRYGQIEDGTPLVLIGNPLGLPTKVAEGASVLKNDIPNSFFADIDAFGGNSGSAVIDAGTGVVEGILVSGEDDFVYDAARGCYKENICNSYSCQGEVVTRVTRVLELMEILEGTP